jgi:hypothetical protein
VGFRTSVLSTIIHGLKESILREATPNDRSKADLRKTLVLRNWDELVQTYSLNVSRHRQRTSNLECDHLPRPKNLLKRILITQTR